MAVPGPSAAGQGRGGGSFEETPGAPLMGDHPEMVQCRHCESNAVLKRAGSDAWVQCDSCGSLYELVEEGRAEERPAMAETPRKTAWTFVREILRSHPVLLAFGLAIALAVVVLSRLTASVTSQGLLIRMAPSGATTLVGGRWHGKARELEGPDDHGYFKQKHTYATDLLFDKREGDGVQFSGSFSADATPEVAKREFSGHATIRGDHADLHFSTRGKEGLASSGMMLLHFYPSGPRAEGFYVSTNLKENTMVFGWIELQR
jgi:hypothetical protein